MITTLGLSQRLPNKCDDCGHWRSRHIPHVGCVQCYMANQSALFSKRGLFRRICTRTFTFQISQRDREQAIRAPKDSFGQFDVCAVCDEIWMAHEGFLCPNGETTFVLAK